MSHHEKTVVAKDADLGWPRLEGIGSAEKPNDEANAGEMAHSQTSTHSLCLHMG